MDKTVQPESPGSDDDATEIGILSEEGVWEIATQSAIYLASLNEGTLTRFPYPTKILNFSLPSQLRRDFEEVPLVRFVQCKVGSPMVAILDIRGDGTLTIRESTVVLHIHRL